MAGVKDKAAKIRRLQDDPTFKEVMEGVRMLQVSIFMDPASTTEALDEAHDIIRALSKIEDYINTVFADEAIFDKKGR